MVVLISEYRMRVDVIFGDTYGYKYTLDIYFVCFLIYSAIPDPLVIEKKIALYLRARFC